MDFELVRGATVTGTVTFPEDYVPGSGENGIVQVFAHATEIAVAHGTVDSAGAYQIVGVPAGSVDVMFRPSLEGGFGVQWYEGVSSQEAATPVELTAGQTTSGIDFTASAAARVTGTFSIPAEVTLADKLRVEIAGVDSAVLSVDPEVDQPADDSGYSALTYDAEHRQFTFNLKVPSDTTGHGIEVWVWDIETESDGMVEAERDRHHHWTGAHTVNESVDSGETLHIGDISLAASALITGTLTLQGTTSLADAGVGGVPVWIWVVAGLIVLVAAGALVTVRLRARQ